MAYELNKYNGTFFVSVDDQTLNTTATDLRFVGRNYSGYGEVENENFLHLLENFANSSAPAKAIVGQLWFDTSVKKLKVFDGTKFKIASSAESSATSPTGLSAGDFWWDNQNEQINVWNGTQFIVVGPEKAPVYGLTSTSPAVVKDQVGTEQQIIKFQVGGEVIAIVSRAAFDLNTNINPITGFFHLEPGINFINSSYITGATTSSHRFWGTAANSDRLGGFAASDFIRSSSSTFNSRIVLSDSGLSVGDQQDVTITVANGSIPVVESTKNQPIVFRISNNGADVKDIFVLKPTGIEPGTTGIYDLGSTTAKWRNIVAETVRANTFYGTFVGDVQSTNPSVPLAIQSVAVSGNFSMSAATGAASNFNVNLAGSSSSINLSSGSVGAINNFNIGGSNPGSARFTTLASSGAVAFSNTTVSSGPGTGALVVSGGASVGGNLYVSGNGGFLGTGAISVSAGTTGNRPTVPLQGMIRFNTTLGEWEGFDGSTWRFLGAESNEDYGTITSVADVYVDYGGLN